MKIVMVRISHVHVGIAALPTRVEFRLTRSGCTRRKANGRMAA
jgi:hypothetical protein